MTINLSKGQQVSLTKSGGGELGVVRMGLGWKSAPRKG
ncbi:TerD family protein, partial [Streptomyces sp. SID8455]|nr:TerD family protein [Streptomyces sp. SID8455]